MIWQNCVNSVDSLSMPVFSSFISEPLLVACMILVDPRLWNCCIILHGPSISQQYTNTIWQKFVYFILLYEYYLLSIVYIHIQQIKYTIACMTNKRNWCFHYAHRGVIPIRIPVELGYVEPFRTEQIPLGISIICIQLSNRAQGYF